MIILLLILLSGLIGGLLGSRISLEPPKSARERIEKQFPPIRNQSWNKTAVPAPPNNADNYFNMEPKEYLITKSALTSINIAISMILIFIYLGTFRKIHSDFTLGLTIVMFAFLVYGITSNPIFYSIFGYWGFGLGPFQMMPDLFASLALGILLYLSLK